MDNSNRTQEFQKNTEVEGILSLLDQHLSEIEERLTGESSSSKYPPVFIFGCARSGTTVLHQYLIQNISCIYPSNFLSRFYYAPYVGGLYYKMFTHLDVRGELLGDSNSTPEFYSSNLGKTEGIHSPNEFWYFWRNHFEINSRGTINASTVNPEKVERFKKSIFALQNLFSGPFITKGLIANNCIDLLERIFPDAIFIHLRRDVFDNARSLYNARLKFFGTAAKWYSFYPKDPDYYEQFDSEEQVVRQVHDTNNEIEHSLEECLTNRIIKIRYHDFCEKPGFVLDQIKDMADIIDISSNPVPSNFKKRGTNDIQNEIDRNIHQVIEELQ